MGKTAEHYDTTRLFAGGLSWNFPRSKPIRIQTNISLTRRISELVSPVLAILAPTAIMSSLCVCVEVVDINLEDQEALDSGHRAQGMLVQGIGRSSHPMVPTRPPDLQKRQGSPNTKVVPHQRGFQQVRFVYDDRGIRLWQVRAVRSFSNYSSCSAPRCCGHSKC